MKLLRVVRFGLLFASLIVPSAFAGDPPGKVDKELADLQRAIDERLYANGIPRPIILTISKPGPYKEYLDEFLRRVLWASDLQLEHGKEHPQGSSTTVMVDLARDGTVIRVVGMSKPLDESTFRHISDSVMRSAPFAPFPGEIPASRNYITIIFSASWNWGTPDQ